MCDGDRRPHLGMPLPTEKLPAPRHLAVVELSSQPGCKRTDAAVDTPCRTEKVIVERRNCLQLPVQVDMGSRLVRFLWDTGVGGSTLLNFERGEDSLLDEVRPSDS